MDEKITFTREKLINICTSVQDSLEREERLVDAFLRELEEKTDAEEFRTPKKIIFEVPNYDAREGAKPSAMCPCCGIWVSSARRAPFCQNCGQALDWTNFDSEVTK